MSSIILIAKRYFFSKKSYHIVNLISWVSVFGISFGTAALIIILSAFNGIDGLVKDIYRATDADIVITHQYSKYFEYSNEIKKKLNSLESVKMVVNPVIEERIIIKNKDAFSTVLLKGVDSSYYKTTRVLEHLDSNFTKPNLKKGLLIGSELAYNLGVLDGLGRSKPTVMLIYPNVSKINSYVPTSKFKRRIKQVEGIFYISPEFDAKYILAPIDFVSSFLGMNQSSKLMVSDLYLSVITNNEETLLEISRQIKKFLGENYEVKTSYEKNEIVFKTNQIEKWITFLIMLFTLVLASFNIIGTLTMLSLEKKQDIKILKAMGANNGYIRKIFFAEGFMITILGLILGLVLGYGACFLQIKYKLIRFAGIVEHYPVKLMWEDFIGTLSVVLVVGVLASWYPLRKIKL